MGVQPCHYAERADSWPANPGPDPHLPNIDVYLIAPINPADPFAKGVVIPSPPAPQPIIVAVHDTVQVRPHGPANCYGIDVLPGPEATKNTVLTRPDPNGGATLAYDEWFAAIVIGVDDNHINAEVRKSAYG